MDVDERSTTHEPTRVPAHGHGCCADGDGTSLVRARRQAARRARR